jgi:hypothetical protein
VPRAVTLAYGRYLLALWETVGEVAEDGRPVPRLLELSTVGEEVIRDFEERLEPRLGDEGDLGYMADWAAKLAGAAVRIAGILHASHCVAAGGPIATLVGPGPVRDAVTLAERYLLPHARIAYAMLGQDQRAHPARKVLDWIRREELASFSRRDAHRSLHRQFRRAEELDPVLDLLVRHGFIRPQDAAPREGPGRSPSPVFEVHPVLNK